MAKRQATETGAPEEQNPETQNPETSTETSQPEAPAVERMEVEQDIEDLAGVMYDTYCEAVGGKAFNGDPLPGADEFMNDPEKQLQANAWRIIAQSAKQMFEVPEGNEVSSVDDYEFQDDDDLDDAETDELDGDEEHVIEHKHVKMFGLKLNKGEAMQLQPHITRIALHGNDTHEKINI